MNEIIQSLSILFIAVTTIIHAVWLNGTCRRLDALEDLVWRCQLAIATSRHVAYDDLDMRLKEDGAGDD